MPLKLEKGDNRLFLQNHFAFTLSKLVKYVRVFPKRLTHWGGGIFINRLLFSLLFSGNFCGGQGLDGGAHSRDGGRGSPSPRH